MKFAEIIPLQGDQSMAVLNVNSGEVRQKLNEKIDSGSRDYNSWRMLISEIETACPEDMQAISLAYDYFMSIFPLCHWHLEKYAYLTAKLCSTEEAIVVYERSTALSSFSVGFWVDYFRFASSCFEEHEDVRRLFRRAIDLVGKNYLCHLLWDIYLKYEFKLGGWQFLARSYIETLRFPTKKLHFYYDNFKQFIDNLEQEVGYVDDGSTKVDDVSTFGAVTKLFGKINLIIKDLLGSSDIFAKSKALSKYRYIGEEFYRESCRMDDKIKSLEMKIKRQYFFVTPLDDDQLKNWHLYLDFMEKQDDLDWAMKLYERCLIPCAKQPEFWMRYVDFLEAKGGRELAISALERATKVFLKDVPDIHLFYARFKEYIGDVNGARSALLPLYTNTDSVFVENVRTLANLERRLGNYSVASSTYERALKIAREKRRLLVLPSLYYEFAQFTLLITNSAASARDVLIEGVQNVPHCKFLLEELIKLAMSHEDACQVNIIDSIIADATSPGSDEYGGLNASDRESISNLFIQFVSLRGTVQDIQRAWNRHVRLFPGFFESRAAACTRPITYRMVEGYMILHLVTMKQQTVLMNLNFNRRRMEVRNKVILLVTQPNSVFTLLVLMQQGLFCSVSVRQQTRKIVVELL